MMKKKNLRLEINDNLYLDRQEVLCDWKIYKLILFNFFQNAVKYNEKDGYIKVDLNFLSLNLND